MKKWYSNILFYKNGKTLGTIKLWDTVWRLLMYQWFENTALLQIIHKYLKMFFFLSLLLMWFVLFLKYVATCHLNFRCTRKAKLLSKMSASMNLMRQRGIQQKWENFFVFCFPTFQMKSVLVLFVFFRVSWKRENN